MAMKLMMKLTIVMSLIMKWDLLEEVGMIEKRNFSRKIPKQYKEMRTITSLNLLQHSHSEEKFIIQSSFLYPIKDPCTWYLYSQRQGTQHILQRS